MLRTIITKESFDNMLNLRFIIGFLLCIIITLSCVIILSHDYQKEMKDYYLRVALQDAFLNNYAHTNRIGGMIVPQKPPEQFRPLVIGIPRDADLGSYDDNPLPVLFPPIDLIFIVTINPNIKWDGSAWVTFFILILASICFIAAFYLLGLLVSTFSRYSSTSILTALFLWVLFILVIPNISPIWQRKSITFLRSIKLKKK